MLVPFEVSKARSVLRVNRVWPRVDILTLLSKYAKVEFTNIPIDVDAVCLNLKVSGRRPVVIVNNTRPSKRCRFTMAHELGHIMIPWHRGLIVDDTSALPDRISNYFEMECEANRFASELLMPDGWILPLVEQSTNMADLARQISEDADVSLPAAIIRMRSSLPSGFIFAEVDSDSIVKSSWRSPETIANELNVGEHIDPVHEFKEADSRWNLRGTYTTYWWWKLPTSMDLPSSTGANWRTILLVILADFSADEAARKRAYASVSATAANANSRSGASTEEIYAAISQRFSSKAKTDPLFSYLMSHPQIEQYIVSRALTFRH